MKVRCVVEPVWVGAELPCRGQEAPQCALSKCSPGVDTLSTCRYALHLIAAGAAIGLLVSAALSGMLGTMLFNVQPLDPWTFVLVTIMVALTAAVSAAGPAWRATRIDPVDALRSE